MATKKPAAAATTVTPSLGSLIDQAHALREVKRDIQKQLDEVDDKYKVVEASIFEALAAQDVTASRGSKASASVSTTMRADPVDWDAFYKWVKRTGNFHLFHRRITDAAYVEMLELKGAVPGLQPIYVKRLNLKSL